MKKTIVIRGLAAGWLAAAGAAAWAQDYAVSAAAGRWVTPPVGATDILPNFPARADSSFRVDTLPFAVAYYGRTYSSLSVGTNGFVQFGGGAATTSAYASFPQSAATDGVCAVAWGALDGSGATAQILTWTDGVAPARRFIVSWMDFQDAGATGLQSMQVQFQEDTGRIVFAYAPTWTAQSVEAVGIDAVTTPASGADARWNTPDGTPLYAALGLPASDFQFDAPDDADEPNNVAGQAVACGQIGFVRANRALKQGDQDWYGFQVANGGDQVSVDVAYDVAAYASTQLTLEVRTPGGVVLAMGSLASAAGPFRAVVPTLPAGDYLVRLRHDGGRALGNYTLQAYPAFTLTTPTLATWTVGRRFEAPISISGGVAPYTIAVADWSGLPPGLVFDAAGPRLAGTPSLAGHYDVIWTCRDSGSPANAASLVQSFVVNPAMDVRLGEFTAFALGKSAARSIPSAGGTAPFVCEAMSGALPHGVTFDPSGLGFLGAPDEAGGTHVSVAAMDSAGSRDETTTTAVVCSPMGAFDLGDGASASGVYFDALEGSVLKLSVATEAKAPKRALRGILLLPDGTTSANAKVVAHPGKLDVTRFVAPASGRYYFVVASDVGPATSLVAKAKLAPPVRGAGSAAAFASGDRLTVDVGAVQGSTLTLTAKWGRSGPTLVVQSLVDPNGAIVPVTPVNLKASKGSLVLTQSLGIGGTWKVVLAGAQFGPGKITYSYKVAAPRGATYSAD